MKTFASFGIACALAAVFGSAQAAELVATTDQTKAGRTAISFDIVSDVQLAGFNFEIQIDGLTEGKAKIDRCGAELPAGFEASCQVKNGVLMVYGVSSKPNVGIGPGIAGIGMVELSGVAPMKKNAPLKILSMDASDQAGKSVGLTAASAVDGSIAK